VSTPFAYLVQILLTACEKTRVDDSAVGVDNTHELKIQGRMDMVLRSFGGKYWEQKPQGVYQVVHVSGAVAVYRVELVGEGTGKHTCLETGVSGVGGDDDGGVSEGVEEDVDAGGAGVGVDAFDC